MIAIAAGATHNLALRNDGVVVAWGDNTYGQINGSLAGTNVVAIAAREGRNVALSQRNLKINSFEISGANLLLRFHTFVGREYSLEYSPDLAPSSWVDLTDNSLQGVGAETTFIDTNALLNAPIRFYRLKQNAP